MSMRTFLYYFTKNCLSNSGMEPAKDDRLSAFSRPKISDCGRYIVHLMKSTFLRTLLMCSEMHVLISDKVFKTRDRTSALKYITTIIDLQ